jgi:COMPASS component SWD2
MSPANDDFMSCSEDGTVRLWAVNSQHSRGWLKLHGAYLAAYDPSASVIAIASGTTNTVLLYDSRNFDKQPFATFDLLGMESRFDPGARGRNWTNLEFSNDGKSLLVGTAGAGHFVLDSFEGNLKHFCKRPARSHRRAAGDANSTAPPTQGDVCFSPDGQFLVGGTGTEEGVVVWDIRGPDSGDTPLGHFSSLQFPDDKKDGAEVVAFNPRFNMLCSADRGLSLWLPDRELYSKFPAGG